MQYYIITDSLAQELGLTKYRKGNAADGWLVNQSDLAVCGTERALAEVGIAISVNEAKEFINLLK